MKILKFGAIRGSQLSELARVSSTGDHVGVTIPTVFRWHQRSTWLRFFPWLGKLALTSGLWGCQSAPCGGDACLDSVTESQHSAVPSRATEGDASPVYTSSAADATGVTPPDMAACTVGQDCVSGVCSNSNQCIACSEDRHCKDDKRPYCKISTDENENRCIGCQNDTDCGEDGKGVCLREQCFESCDPSDPSACPSEQTCVQDSSRPNTFCAECGAGIECADPALLCVDNTCLPCDPSKPEASGCADATPHCVPTATLAAAGDAGTSDAGSAHATSCVECRPWLGSGDCSTGTCVDGACQTCSPMDNQGCGDDAPVCISTAEHSDAGETTYRCVECQNAGDCGEGAQYCIDNRCALCEPTTSDGCGQEAKVCVNIAPEPAPPSYECRECSESAPCESGYCHSFDCVSCIDSSQCTEPAAPECTSEFTCDRCTSDDACAARPGTPLCDIASGRCIECRSDANCESLDKGTPVCRTDSHQCVECTQVEHCPDTAIGCWILPGLGENTCQYPEAETPLGLCGRCLAANDCGDDLVCAVFTDETDARCYPPPDSGAECDLRTLFIKELGNTAQVCAPEDCPPP